MATLPDPTSTFTGEDRLLYQHILERREALGVEHLGPYVPLLNHPHLAERIEETGYFIKYEGSLERDVYQFVVLSVAKRSGVAFVWADHVAAARKAGLPEAVIAAIDAGTETFPDPFDLAREVTTCAFAYRSIPADLQARAIARFGMKGFIEIVVLCGFYELMSMINGCFDVAIPKNESA